MTATRKASDLRPMPRSPLQRFPVLKSFDGEESRTHQSFRDDADASVIVERYARTGILPGQTRKPEYGDAPTQSYFESALLVAESASALEEQRLDPDPSPSDENPSEGDSDALSASDDSDQEPQAPESDTAATPDGDGSEA